MIALPLTFLKTCRSHGSNRYTIFITYVYIAMGGLYCQNKYYKVSTVKDTLDIYKTFEYLKENEEKRYNDLSKSEKQFLKDGVLKCEQMIKNEQ